MKKIYTSRVFLTLCMITLFSLIGGVNEALAQTEKTVTSTFKDKNLNTNEERANIWTADKTASSKETRGVQFLNSAGETKLTSTKSISNITKVEVVCQTNNTSKPVVGITVRENTVDSLLETKSKEYTVICKPASPTSGIITITLNKGKKATANSIYVKSIKVYYNEGGETPDPTTNTITFTPATGTEFVAAQNITLKTAIEGSTIYYTTDGTEPTTASAQYTEEGIFISKSGTTIKALAVAEGTDDATAEATYTIKPEQPVFSQGSTTFKTPLSIALSLPETASKGATIHYAIGERATAESALYEHPVTITGVKEGDKFTLHAVVVDEYGNVGTEKYCTYTYTDAIVFDFTPKEGVFDIMPTADGNAKESNVDGKDMTVAGVTIVTSSTGTVNKLWNTGSECQLRIYTGNSLNISAPEGFLLENVIFTFDGTYNGKFKTENLSLNTKSTTFTTDSKQARIKTISITLIPAPTSYTLSIGSTGYSTLCLDKAYTMPEGLHGAVVSVKDKELNVEYMYEANNIVAAGMPLLIKADEAKDYTLVYSTEAGTDFSSETMMSGKVDASGMAVGEAGSKFYKLAAPNGVIGFYWGATDGGAFKNGENKAYLVVPADVAMSVQGFRLDGQTTGIGSAETGGEAARAIYGIDGRRINGQLNELPRGIYIVNGKKVIK